MRRRGCGLGDGNAAINDWALAMCTPHDVSPVVVVAVAGEIAVLERPRLQPAADGTAKRQVHDVINAVSGHCEVRVATSHMHTHMHNYYCQHPCLGVLETIACEHCVFH